MRKEQSKKILKKILEYLPVIIGLLTIIIIILLPNVNASISDLGTFKQGQSINLIQTCDTCSYNNITTIKLADGTLLTLNTPMNKSGTTYNYTLNGNYTTSIGEYIVNGVGDLDGTNTVWAYNFDIKGGILGFFILGFVLTYGLTFWGLKIKNEWIALVGCFGLLLLGVFTSFNGIDLYKNDLTTAISYITIAVGLGVGFEALREITYY